MNAVSRRDVMRATVARAVVVGTGTLSDLIMSPAAKKALDLGAEPESLRERYGKTREGQSTLLARRLLRAR